jgi:integral membrane protein
VTNPAPARLGGPRVDDVTPAAPVAASPDGRRPGSRLVPIGLVVFALGLVVIVATFIGYAAGDDNRPLAQNLLCLLAPLGFALALVGLVGNGRAEARRVAARYPTAARPALTRLPRPATARAAMRWVAIAEATSWVLLIVATVVKYVFGQPLAVQILGPIHGTLFLAYLGVVAAAWWSLRWTLWTAVIVVVDSLLPGGGFVVARRRDLRPTER